MTLQPNLWKVKVVDIWLSKMAPKCHRCQWIFFFFLESRDSIISSALIRCSWPRRLKTPNVVIVSKRCLVGFPCTQISPAGLGLKHINPPRNEILFRWRAEIKLQSNAALIISHIFPSQARVSFAVRSSVIVRGACFVLESDSRVHCSLNPLWRRASA